jgi:hypothetical protein
MKLKKSPKRQLQAYITLILTFLLFLSLAIESSDWVLLAGSIIAVTWAWRISDLSYTGLTFIMFLIGILTPIVFLQMFIWMSSSRLSLFQLLSNSELFGILSWLILSIIVSVIWFWILKHHRMR